MKNTMPQIHSVKSFSLVMVLMLMLVGCTTPGPEAAGKVYDFGPAPRQALATPAPVHMAPLVLVDVQATPSLEGNALLYRLAYADAQQLKPYALARWSMPPAQLVDQRLRQQLGAQRAVLAPGELLPASASSFAASAAPLLNLRLVLEEFSQVFDSPTESHGLLRLRATLTQRALGGETFLAQRSFVVWQAAPTPDAPGAVRALTAASNELAAQLAAWLALWEHR